MKLISYSFGYDKDDPIDIEVECDCGIKFKKFIVSIGSEQKCRHCGRKFKIIERHYAFIKENK